MAVDEGTVNRLWELLAPEAAADWASLSEEEQRYRRCRRQEQIGNLRVLPWSPVVDVWETPQCRGLKPPEAGHGVAWWQALTGGAPARPSAMPGEPPPPAPEGAIDRAVRLARANPVPVAVGAAAAAYAIFQWWR